MTDVMVRGPLTMTSREIAALTGKRHDNVMRDIRLMLLDLYGAGGVLNFEDTHQNEQNSQSYAIYRLPKRESLVLVSGYSVTMRARIIDRWQELEERAAPAIPNFADPAAAARAWADQFEARTALERKVVADAPKVEFAETVRNMDAGVTMLQMAKLLGWGRNKFMAQLRAHSILTKNNVPYQKWIDKGYFTVAESTVNRTKGVMPVLSTLVTGAGQVFLQRRYAPRAA
jgi:anti-repressor protein